MEVKSSLYIGAILVAGMLLFGCTSYGGSPSAVPSSGGAVNAVSGSAHKVVIFELTFNPTALTVKKGATVEFTNKDDMPHTVTSDSGAFESSQLTKGQSWSFTFNSAGEFQYHCSIHPGMKGRIIVTG